MVHRDTIRVYEARAAEWEAQRRPRARDKAIAFGARVGVGPAVDLGCGTGWYTLSLPSPAIALDAARSMLARTGELAPGALRVQGDLERLPIRPGALRGAWAHNSYVHLPRSSLPMALAELHRALRLDALVELTFFGGDLEHGPIAEDDLGGRSFSLWREEHVRDVVVGGGFAIDALDRVESERGEVSFTVQAQRARTLADTVGPGMRMLVCGLNPSIYSTDLGVGYGRPTNRFWRAALEAGLVTRGFDAWRALRVDGVGLTDLVKRASVGAGELTRDEYRDGLARVDRLVAWLRPGAVCFVGLAGWRAAVDRRATAGPQPQLVGGRPAYVMPSTSGLNARTPVAALAAHLEAALALGEE